MTNILKFFDCFADTYKTETKKEGGSVMSISISGMNDLYSNYRQANIPRVSDEAVQAQQNTEKKAPERIPSEVSLPSVQSSPIQNASLEDVSLSLKNEQFDFVGRDSDIESLDVQKAVSDMKKDSIIQQYNYFVGDAFSSFGAQGNEDGIVIQKF